MKISIITVSYNSASTIKDTFESILLQTHSDIEYIVIDGNSSDGTVSIIKEYELKFNGKMKWISESDNGLYDAMNKGIKMATGDIVGILNSDDYYISNDVISSVVNVMSDKNINSCYGNIIYIKKGKPYRYWKSGNYKSFKFGWMPPHPAFFVRKSIYEKYGLFRLDCESAADYELMLRFLEKEKITTFWIDKIFTLMRTGGVSNKNISSRISAYKCDTKAWIVNGLKPYLFSIVLKKIVKIPQYFRAFGILKKYKDKVKQERKNV
jgi:glycosyltransferase involved in cell wall biosynthesis